MSVMSEFDYERKGIPVKTEPNHDSQTTTGENCHSTLSSSESGGNAATEQISAFRFKICVDNVSYKQKPTEADCRGIKYRFSKISPVACTIEELCGFITNGQTICPATIEPVKKQKKNTGEIYYSHCREGWKEQQLFLVDIDNDAESHVRLPDDTYLPVSKAMELCNHARLYGCLIYKSFSYTAQHERYRIGFLLDEPVTDEQERFKIISALVNFFGAAADHSITNGDRLLYGSTPDSIIKIRPANRVKKQTLLNLYAEQQMKKTQSPCTVTTTPARNTLPYQSTSLPSSHSSDWSREYDFDIDKLLNCLDPNASFHEWISDTAAYKGAGGNVAAWSAWSQMSPKWHDSDTKHWDSLEGTSRASLIAKAQATPAGYAYIEDLKQKQALAKQAFKEQHNQVQSPPRNQPVPKKSTAYCLADLTEEEKQPPEFLVNHLIPVGLSIIAAPPKSKKSFFALQMAMAVGAGKPFLGFPSKQSLVFYYDLESSKSRISSRSIFYSNEEKCNLMVDHDTTATLGDGSMLKEIKNFHQQYPACRLFIIDTYSCARGHVAATGSNAYDADVKLLKPVQRMAQELKIAIVLIHHTKKGADKVSDSFEKASGTMGITGSADSVLNITLKGNRSENKASLEFTPRDMESGTLEMDFDSTLLLWKVHQEQPEEYKNNTIIKWILENAPQQNNAARFISYQDLYHYTIHDKSYNAELIKKPLEQYKQQLYINDGIAVQIGARGENARGIRIMHC